MSTAALALFTRAPKLHETKTRLAPVLGAEGALAAHIELVEHCLVQSAAVTSVSKSLWSTALDRASKKWANDYALSLHEQLGADLGERMHNVFVTLHASGAQRMVLMGTDCPDIDAAYIEHAFAQLHDYDVVLGPAEDGGYGLIGLRKPAAHLFSDIPWSSENVLTLTQQRIEAGDLLGYLCPLIWDVDTPADWQRYREQRSSG